MTKISPRVMLLSVIAGVAALGILYNLSRTSPAQSAQIETEQGIEVAEQQTSVSSEYKAVSTANVGNTLRATEPGDMRASTALPPPTEASPQSRQLVAELQLDLSSGKITEEQAERWKVAYQALIAQGQSAVPAIGEYLQKNQDLTFSAVTGSELLGQVSLRTALINSLAQIGGPEAVSLLGKTLEATTLPSEIVQVSTLLNQMAPGQYQQETLKAVNEVLAMVMSGQLPKNWDVAPLFGLLANNGDANSAANLEQLQSQWKFYATMSLAGMEGGEGIPMLIRQIEQPGTGSRRDFAFQMLAQEAAKYPDATTALIEQARQNKIPESAWKAIVSGLSGDQYYVGAQPPGANGLPGIKSYHIDSGNQNFYSVPLASSGAAPELEQRLAIIDQLLAATSNPSAVEALQGARASLASGKAAN